MLPSQALCRLIALSVTGRLRTLCQLPRTRGSQEHARGQRLSSGKANLKSGFSCCVYTAEGTVFCLKPPRGAARRAQGVHLWVAGCAAEALPAAETAEAEQGQRSVFCKGAATPEAKAGHRNPGGLDINNAGASLTADPRRGTLSFVTQKFFCFGAINNRRNNWCVTPFCRHMKRVEHLNQQGLMPASSLYQSRYGAAGTVISTVSIKRERC